MSWVYSFDPRALKKFRKLDQQTQKKIIDYLDNRILRNADPRCLGKELRGKLSGFWRYRVGDYRIVCEILDHELLILIVTVGHRKDVYN